MNTNWSQPTSLPSDLSSPNVPVVVPAAVPERAPSKQRVAKPSSVDVWGTAFAELDMAGTVDLVNRVVQARVPEYLITANLNYMMLTEQEPRLPEINERAIAVIADGHPVVRQSRLIGTPLPCRVAGSDLIVELAKLSAQEGYRIFFLGAAPGVAQAAADALVAEYPEMQIAGCYSPPFRQLSQAEHAAMLQQIRDAKTDILLVAFGQPKGEMWIYDNLQELGVPLSIQLGASFDFLAGNARRAPACWQATGCEWLYRALSDPRRLMPRYAANIVFLVRKMFQHFVRKTGNATRTSL